MSDGLDAYRPKGSALELSIGLTPADVAGLATFGKVSFAVPGAIPAEGSTTVAPELFTQGVRRILDYYVLGQHAGYGLSNFAEPTPFLLLLRQLVDDLYAAITPGPVLDTSPGNADMEPIIRALYPEAARVTAPVIVVGFPRSGTTWLQRMLQSHPALAGPDGETCLFTSVRDVLDNRALASLVGHDAVVDSVRDFGAALCAHWQADHAPDARRLVEKTPSNVDNLDTIVELFPEASIVGIYRDGRDVVHSLLQVQFGTDDPVVATKGWARSVRKLQEFAARSDRIRVVRYEELRAAPVEHVVDLLRWLGLPTDADVRSILGARAGTQVSQHHVRETEELSAREARAVYRHGGDLLVELGYASAGDVKAVKRRPGYAVDLLRGRAAWVLMRNR